MFAVRPYREDDAESVLAIWWDSWHSIQPGIHHPQSFVEWRSRWFAEIVPAQTIVVVEDRKILVGFAAAELRSRELTQLFVMPSQKRRGIGDLLIRWAQDQMPGGFHLQTLTQNIVSRKFYDHHGLVHGLIRLNPFNGMETVEYRWTPSA